MLLLVLGVDALGLLAHQLALLNAELLVGFEVNFARLLERFLSDEGGHFAQLRVDLRVGHAVYLGHGGRFEGVCVLEVCVLDWRDGSVLGSRCISERDV